METTTATSRGGTEEHWSAAYLLAVAAQLAIDEEQGSPLAAELARLRAEGVRARPFLLEVEIPDPPPALGALRDAVAAVRRAGRETFDRHSDAVGWAVSAFDWPLWGGGLPDGAPEFPVEMLMFDQEVDGPFWEERARVAGYGDLRLLSMRGNRLHGPLGIDLGVLPRLACLSLSENALEVVPPEVRACPALVHLNLRDNRLTAVEVSELPGSLRWLDVSQNCLPEGAVARLRVALPGCEVASYGQRA